MDLISIIVPVYNVETYIERCIESILNQTYSNLQIILVDDGSTDKSGEICDYYSRQDSRIEIFHKKNGGAAEARNMGLTKIRAKYVTFMDSDDVIHEDYISFLYNQLIETNADISICRYKRFIDIKEVKNLEMNEKTQIYDNVNALKILLYSPEKIPHSAYAKMYKSKLFETIKFPIGKTGEDIGTTYKVFNNAKKIAYNSSQYYFYFQRMDGVVRSKFSKRTMDALDFADEIMVFAKRQMPAIEKASICYAFSQNVQVLIKLPYKQKEYQNETERVVGNIKRYRRIVLCDSYVSIPRRLGALATYGNLFLIKNLGILYKKIINKEPV